MAIPQTGQGAMLEAIQQFKAGVRSPQGPRPDADWLGNGNHKYVIVHDDEPYPVKEVIRLAVKIATGSWPGTFSGGIHQANRYAEQYHFTIARKEDWLRDSR
jgi:hypothetical protein